LDNWRLQSMQIFQVHLHPMNIPSLTPTSHTLHATPRTSHNAGGAAAVSALCGLRSRQQPAEPGSPQCVLLNWCWRAPPTTSLFQGRITGGRACKQAWIQGNCGHKLEKDKAQVNAFVKKPGSRSLWSQIRKNIGDWD
jgi:hypothetical protein